MTLQDLDFYFPFVVLTYGLIVTWLTQAGWAQAALERLPPDVQAQFVGHRGLALLCVLVGSIWGLQNLFLGY